MRSVRLKLTSCSNFHFTRIDILTDGEEEKSDPVIFSTRYPDKYFSIIMRQTCAYYRLMIPFGLVFPHK